jgi:hypothetical protein
MKVTLNIENDQELRAHVKDAIKGQVLSIVRDEMLDMVRNELDRKIKGMGEYTINKIISEAMTVAIVKILREDHNVSAWGDSFISPVVEKFVTKAIERKDWDKLVNDLAKQKVQSLIK